LSDKAYQKVVNDLREIQQDLRDLHSGRKFPEFDFPGPPTNAWNRVELLNWISFLSDRGFKNALGNKIGYTRTDEEKWIEARSIRIISSVFTYPLTIAHAIFWSAALGDPSNLAKKDEDGNLIPQRITILGPRAEATLPPRAWVELCAIFPEAAFDIHFVGPEIPDDHHDRVLEIAELRLTMTWTKAFYQDVHEYHDLPDLFVAYNSGIGYGSAQDTWRDALELVFNKSNFKPILFTSHSKEDSARDYSYLSRRQDCKFLTRPAENPFMSYKKDVAVNNLKYIIQSNHSYALVRGAPPDGVIPGDSLWEKLKYALK